MTDAELEAIEGRFVAVSSENYSGPYVRVSAQSFLEDVPALIDEVKRLRAELADHHCESCDGSAPECRK